MVGFASLPKWTINAKQLTRIFCWNHSKEFEDWSMNWKFPSQIFICISSIKYLSGHSQSVSQSQICFAKLFKHKKPFKHVKPVKSIKTLSSQVKPIKSNCHIKSTQSHQVKPNHMSQTLTNPDMSCKTQSIGIKLFQLKSNQVMSSQTQTSEAIHT